MLVMYVSTEMRFLAGLILTLIALVTYFLWPCFDHLSSELLLWISRCRDCLINHISSSCGSIFLFLSIFHLFAKVFFLRTTQETTVLGVGCKISLAAQLHMNGFSPPWVSKCAFKTLGPKHYYLHRQHLFDFSARANELSNQHLPGLTFHTLCICATSPHCEWEYGSSEFHFNQWFFILGTRVGLLPNMCVGKCLP